jgi:hypothetical protein
MRLQPGEEQVIREFCELMAGAEYDTGGVLGFKWGIFNQDSSKFFCSELCVTAIQKVGFLQGIEPWKVSPNRLSLLLNMVTSLAMRVYSRSISMRSTTSRPGVHHPTRGASSSSNTRLPSYQYRAAGVRADGAAAPRYPPG